MNSIICSHLQAFVLTRMYVPWEKAANRRPCSTVKQHETGDVVFDKKTSTNISYFAYDGVELKLFTLSFLLDGSRPVMTWQRR